MICGICYVYQIVDSFKCHFEFELSKILLVFHCIVYECCPFDCVVYDISFTVLMFILTVSEVYSLYFVVYFILLYFLDTVFFCCMIYISFYVYVFDVRGMLYTLLNNKWHATVLCCGGWFELLNIQRLFLLTFSIWHILIACLLIF